MEERACSDGHPERVLLPSDAEGGGLDATAPKQKVCDDLNEGRAHLLKGAGEGKGTSATQGGQVQ